MLNKYLLSQGRGGCKFRALCHAAPSDHTLRTLSVCVTRHHSSAIYRSAARISPSYLIPESYSSVWTPRSLLNLPAADRHLGCRHVLAVTDTAAVNTGSLCTLAIIS